MDVTQHLKAINIKLMKTIFLSLTMLFVSTLTFAQNKNAKASIEVDGV